MNRAPWFKFDSADWISNRTIRYLTAEQRGYLVQLRAEMWESEVRGTLPDNPEMLWQFAGAESRDRFEQQSQSVMQLFQRRDGLIICPMLSEQASMLNMKSKARSKAGKASGESRRKKSTSNTCSTNSEQKRRDTDTDTDTDEKQIQKQTENPIPPTPLTKGGVDNSGSDLWQPIKTYLSEQLSSAYVAGVGDENDYEKYFHHTWFKKVENDTLLIGSDDPKATSEGLRKYEKRISKAASWLGSISRVEVAQELMVS